jgi:hypothetical protein
MDKKPIFCFKDLRGDPSIESIEMEVSIAYMPSSFDSYLKIKDNQGETIVAFLKNIKERNIFHEKFSNKQKVLISCSLSGEYASINIVEKEEVKEPAKGKKKTKKTISEVIPAPAIVQEPAQEEVIPIVVETPIETPKMSEEEIKHVRKTIEQEIKESIYKNPINLDSIKENPELELDLSEYGINNTQIFTRKVDIDKMLNSIGLDYIKNPETTILEPTSGDGAFTTRILELRLEAFKENTIEQFLISSLKALSTIYSIEYELPSLEVQRNNMYTLMIKYLNEHLITDEDKKYFGQKETQWKNTVKQVIFYNIIWGATSTKMDSDYNISETPMLGKYRSNDMPIVIRQWTFKKDKKGIMKYSFRNII